MSSPSDAEVRAAESLLNALTSTAGLPTGPADTYPGDLMLIDGYPDNDDGNAQRFLRRHGPNVRYCEKWQTWLIYQHGQWVRDEQLEVQSMCKDVSRELYHLAAETEDEDERERILKAAKNAGEQPRIVRTLQSASSSPIASSCVEDYDSYPMLINCQNGIIDLTTGSLQPHSPDLYITRQVPRRYDPNAKAPKWEAFLDKIMGGNVEMVAYLQRALGYSLVGDNRHRVFFLFWGGGANGKSTLVNTISEVLGQREGSGYAMHTDPNTFMEERYETRRPRPDLARLHGTRFVVAVEPRDDSRLDPGVIKRATGGDPITCRQLFQKEFNFLPQFKIYLCCNNKPAMNGADAAMVGRLRFIPFNVTISKEERIENYSQQLLEEADGIFSWLVCGALDSIAKGGLADPQIVLDATNEYRVEMDDIQPFVNDCIDVDPPGQVSLNGNGVGLDSREPMKQLYRVYDAYCRFNGTRAMSRRKFADRLRQKGFPSKNGTGNQIEFHGLRLNSSGLSYIDIDAQRNGSSMGYPDL